MQRLADSWRSSIGSTALSVLIAFFESHENLKDSDDNRAEFAEYALDKLRFCYKKANGDDEEVGVFVFVLPECVHANATYCRIFEDFIKAVSLFRPLANIFRRSMALKRFLAFMIQRPGLVELSHYQLQQ